MEGFELIFQTYYEQIYRFVFLLVGGNESEAEELTQETFYQAFLSLHRFRGDCQMSTWLCQIAKNVTSKYIRKNSRLHYIDMKAEPLQNYAGILYGEPEQMVENAEKGALIYQSIRKQKKRDRDVLIFRLYYDMSFSEIARVLHITEENGRAIYSRARKKLIKEMEEQGYVREQG